MCLTTTQCKREGLTLLLVLADRSINQLDTMKLTKLIGIILIMKQIQLQERQ
jgi:hypothetical protein